MTNTTRRRIAPSAGGHHRPESGFSLPEVLLAAALMGMVLIAVLSMFVYGTHHVQSGKLMTKATSIATDSLEQFRRLGFRQTYQVINDTKDPRQNTRYVWNSVNNLPDYPGDADYRAILNDWAALVRTTLPRGEMTITVRGLGDIGPDPPEIRLFEARLLQVVVTVRWVERKRLRSVVFETLKA